MHGLALRKSGIVKQGKSRPRLGALASHYFPIWNTVLIRNMARRQGGGEEAYGAGTSNEADDADNADSLMNLNGSSPNGIVHL